MSPVEHVSISVYFHWQKVWLEIADAHLVAARDARGRYGATGNTSDDSAALSAELHEGLVAIAAAAFAVEARKNEIGGVDGPRPEITQRKINVGDWVGWWLWGRDQVTITERDLLGELFRLRHESVHPEHGWDSTLPLHPVGTRTSGPNVAYRVEVAEEVVAVARLAVAALGHGTDLPQ